MTISLCRHRTDAALCCSHEVIARVLDSIRARPADVLQSLCSATVVRGEQVRRPSSGTGVSAATGWETDEAVTAAPPRPPRPSKLRHRPSTEAHAHQGSGVQFESMALPDVAAASRRRSESHFHAPAEPRPPPVRKVLAPTQVIFGGADLPTDGAWGASRASVAFPHPVPPARTRLDKWAVHIARGHAARRDRTGRRGHRWGSGGTHRRGEHWSDTEHTASESTDADTMWTVGPPLVHSHQRALRTVVPELGGLDNHAPRTPHDGPFTHRSTASASPRLPASFKTPLRAPRSAAGTRRPRAAHPQTERRVGTAHAGPRSPGTAPCARAGPSGNAVLGRWPLV